MRAKLTVARSIERRYWPRRTMIECSVSTYSSRERHQRGIWRRAMARLPIHAANRSMPPMGSRSAVATPIADSVVMTAMIAAATDPRR
jgi:hypothetical protein